jgi:hypothetical protein
MYERVFKIVYLSSHKQPRTSSTHLCMSMSGVRKKYSRSRVSAAAAAVCVYCPLLLLLLL